jgi:hypothetical protein
MGVLRVRRAAVPVLMGGNAAVFTGTGAYDDYESSLVHVYEPARRTLTSYEGDLIRLRRDSDDAESDFGYDSDGYLDTAAIGMWLGASSGYGVTVYDQVGGDDVTQATKTAQPLYVASLQNGHPGFRFDGINHNLQGAFTNGGALSHPTNFFIVGKLDVAAVNDDQLRYLIDGDDPSSRVIIAAYATSDPDEWSYFSGSHWQTGSDSDPNWHLFSLLINGSSSELWLDTMSDSTGYGGNATPEGITIGARYDGSDFFWDGDIAIPAIIADPALSAADRAGLETAINAYWGVF